MFQHFAPFFGRLRYDGIMAKHPSKDDFLGGGPAFNQAGSTPPPTEDSGPGALRPVPRRDVRLILVLLLVLILASALLYVGGGGIPGVTHTQSRGGVSPADRPAEPPRNF